MKKFIFVIFALILISGCKTLEVKTPDGLMINYSSYGDSSIESIYFEKTETTMKAYITNSKQTEQDLNILNKGILK